MEDDHPDCKGCKTHHHHVGGYMAKRMRRMARRHHETYVEQEMTHEDLTVFIV